MGNRDNHCMGEKQLNYLMSCPTITDNPVTYCEITTITGISTGMYRVPTLLNPMLRTNPKMGFMRTI